MARIPIVWAQTVCMRDGGSRYSLDSHRQQLHRPLRLHPERHQLSSSAHLRRLRAGRALEADQ